MTTHSMLKAVGRKPRHTFGILAAVLAGHWGCASPPSSDPSVVEAALQRSATSGTSTSQQPATKPNAQPQSSGSRTKHSGPPARQPNRVIATVNGVGIGRERLVTLLMESHGAAVLDQLIGLDAVKQDAAAKGVQVSSADIRNERRRTLESLTNPLGEMTGSQVDEQAAESVLETVLRRRNLSPVEFDLVVERNAYLRKIVEAQLTLTDDVLHKEYERLYGSRAEIRHIQLPTFKEAEKVKAQLATGADFAELARKNSANRPSGEDGGLLEPFSIADDRVPEVLRQAAFSLAPNETSDIIRVGDWFHIIQVVRFLPPQNRRFEDVRDEVASSLRNRLTEAGMFPLFEKLFRQAKIEVFDPAIRRAFGKRHPDLLRD